MSYDTIYYAKLRLQDVTTPKKRKKKRKKKQLLMLLLLKHALLVNMLPGLFKKVHSDYFTAQKGNKNRTKRHMNIPSLQTNKALISKTQSSSVNRATQILFTCM